jgi:hypothetical protein
MRCPYDNEGRSASAGPSVAAPRLLEPRRARGCFHAVGVALAVARSINRCLGNAYVRGQPSTVSFYWVVLAERPRFGLCDE